MLSTVRQRTSDAMSVLDLMANIARSAEDEARLVGLLHWINSGFSALTDATTRGASQDTEDEQSEILEFIQEVSAVLWRCGRSAPEHLRNTFGDM